MNSKDEIMEMPAEVDFSDSVPNPHIGKARRRVTMNIDGENIDHYRQGLTENRTSSSHAAAASNTFPQSRKHQVRDGIYKTD